MTTAAEIRRNQVIDLLKSEQLTTEEISKRLNCNYNTIYRDCRELQELGLIHYTGQVKDKSYIWASGAARSIPAFFDPAGNRYIRADVIADAYDEGETPASVKAGVGFFEILSQLMRVANELAEESTATAVTDKDLQRIRMQAIVNQSLIKNLSGYYAQLLANENFWSVDLLRSVGENLKKSPPVGG